MKLYTTTTSERASKSQGGNKYIKIDYFVGDTEDSIFLCKTNLYIYDGYYILDIWKPNGEVMELIRIKINK